MVPVLTRAPNITNISCLKIVPKLLVYIAPRILWNYYAFVSGKTIKDWIEWHFSNSGIFPKFRCIFYQSIPHCLRFNHCVPTSPIISKMVSFSIHLLIPAYGQFATIKTSQEEFFFGKTLFQQKQLISHTKTIFLARYRSPNETHLLRMVQPIRSPENPGTTVVSIGHLTPWPENPGYRTQVWDNSDKLIS